MKNFIIREQDVDFLLCFKYDLEKAEILDTCIVSKTLIISKFIIIAEHFFTLYKTYILKPFYKNIFEKDFLIYIKRFIGGNEKGQNLDTRGILS